MSRPLQSAASTESTAGMPTYDVRWLVTPGQDLYAASKVLSGLCVLAAEGAIRLRSTTQLPFVDTHGNPIYLTVRENATGDTRRVVLDLHDRSDWFQASALSFADIYFKRGFRRADVAKLPADMAARVVPFGLNFACLSRCARGRYLVAATRLALQSVRVAPGRAFKRLLDNLRLIKGLPPPRAFEAGDDDAREATVLFQTRVWPPEPTVDDFDAVNRERAELVRALRAAFGTQFVGGVVADAFARQFCPDVLAESDSHRVAYSRLVRRATVGVYTRGLHHSLAFKMSEYLAAGLCIVSEPLVHELPQPLEPGVHYLLFTSREECLAQCGRLLENPAEAARMRQANLRYYREHVAPKVHARSLLARAFEAQPA